MNARGGQVIGLTTGKKILEGEQPNNEGRKPIQPNRIFVLNRRNGEFDEPNKAPGNTRRPCAAQQPGEDELSVVIKFVGNPFVEARENPAQHNFWA